MSLLAWEVVFIVVAAADGGGDGVYEGEFDWLGGGRKEPALWGLMTRDEILTVFSHGFEIDDFGQSHLQTYIPTKDSWKYKIVSL